MSSENQEINTFFRQILENQGDIKERIARVETKQENFDTKLDTYSEMNEKAHNDMVSLITESNSEIHGRIDDVEKNDKQQQTVIDRSMGIWDFVKWGIGIIATLSTGAVAMKMVEKFMAGG